MKNFLNGLRDSNIEIETLRAEREYMLRLDTPETRLRAGDLEKKIDVIVKKQIAASDAIGALSDPVAQCVLKRRYIIGEAWRSIAKSMKSSERNLHYIRDSALPELAETLRKVMNENDEM